MECDLVQKGVLMVVNEIGTSSHICVNSRVYLRRRSMQIKIHSVPHRGSFNMVAERGSDH